MRFHTRAFALLVLILASFYLIQCSDDNATAPNYGDTIDENMAGLSHLQQVEPFSERPVGDAELDEYEVDGRTYECYVQEFEVAAEFNEQISLNPTSDILWPGAILDGATIETGEYVPILAARQPVTISVSLENIENVSTTVADPKLSTMRQAIADILSQEVTGATAATVTSEIQEVYSESQLDIALGVSYKSGVAAVKNQFNFSQQNVMSRTVVKFMQVYFTIDIDLPEKPSDLFASSVTWDNLRQQMSGDISPMYVSTISYGRMALFTMESTHSFTQVRNALNASFQAIKTQVDLSVEHRNVLDETTIKAMILGGSGADAVQAVSGFDGLKQYMTQGGNYNKDTAAAPLAYKLRYLCDNGTCRIVMANNYMVRSCEELKPGRHGIRNDGWYVAWFYVSYDLDGVRESWYSGKYTKGFTRAFEVPAKAKNIEVLAREDTGVGNRTIFRWTSERPEVKCWKVTGTTLSPGYGEIACDF
jgi:thiol-activated cytolysin